MRRFKRKVSPERFERMNAQRARAVLWLRRKMIDAAMAGGRSGFAVQMRMGGRFSDTASASIGLRESRPRER